ncbi:ATP-binding protein [Chloroflexales bacterium ZM16-3]|nr:ATP-binding protein [Chloroflexales bacterium ZM16-3]
MQNFFKTTSNIQPPLPPHPDMPLWALRAILAAIITVIIISYTFQTPLVAWASLYVPQPLWLAPAPARLAAQWRAEEAAARAALDPAERTAADLQAGLAKPFQRIGAAVLLAALRPDAQRILRQVAAGGLGLLGMELVAALAVLASSHRRSRGLRPLYLQLRTLHPQNRGGVPPTDAAALWRRLHASLSTAEAMPLPLTFTLTRTAGAPATLGVVLPDGAPPPPNPRDPRFLFRRIGAAPTPRMVLPPLQPPLTLPGAHAPLPRLVAVLTGILAQDDSSVVLDMVPDPITAALASHPQAILHTTEFQLHASALLPLRLAEARSPGALPELLTALGCPEDVLVSELQIIAAPHRIMAGGPRHDGLAQRLLARLRRASAAPGRAAAIAAIEARRSDHWFRVSLRLALVVADRAALPTARTHARAVAHALESLQANYTSPVGLPMRQTLAAGTFTTTPATSDPARLRLPRPTPPPALLLPRARWRGPLLLSAAELGALWQLPDARAGAQLAWLPNRRLPAPPEARLPHDARDSVTLGWAPGPDGELGPVGIPLRKLHEILHVTAGMGAGKSQFAAALCHQLHSRGFIVLDGKGDDEGGSLVAAISRGIPDHLLPSVVLLDLLDTAWPVGLNPLYAFALGMEHAATVGDRERMFSAGLGAALAIFARLDPTRWSESPGMQQFALYGTALVLRTGSTQPGEVPSILRIKRAMEHDGFRAELLARYPDPHDDVAQFWTQRYPAMGDAQKSSLQALLRRIDLLLVDPITRSLITIERPTIAMADVLEVGRILLIPLPHRQLGGLAELISMIILQTIIGAAYLRPGNAQSRPTVPFVVDELQSFLVDGRSQDFEQAITQLRGFAIGGIYLHQALDQLGDLRSSFLSNAANRIILRTEEPDASVYARQYPQAGLSPADISNQPARAHQYAVLALDSGAKTVISMHPNPWPDSIPDGPATSPARPWWSQPVAQTLPQLAAVAPEQPDAVATLIPMVCRFVYANHTPAFMAHLIQQFSLMPDDLWTCFLELWARLRAAHRQLLIETPALIPNRMERMAWLSRLETRIPGLIADAQLQRLALRGGAVAAIPEPPRRSGRLPAPAATGPRPARTAIIPGLAPEGDVVIAGVHGPSAEELLRQRGRRPSSADIADGFAFGSSQEAPRED